MEDLVVQDGSRILTFSGEKLASVSSQRPSSPRWSEYSVYRTASGSFVVEKIGRSVVVHTPDCTDKTDDLPRFQATHPGKDPADGFWFCESCCNHGYDITSLLIESDRTWATVTDEPQDLVESLYRRTHGARSLPRLSIELLEQLAKIDQRFEDAFRVEHIS